MLDENVLGRCGAALHAIEDNHIGACFDAEWHIILRPRRAELAVDRLLPVSDFSNFLDLDGEIVGAGPIGMAAGTALVNALGQLPHTGNALVDLLAKKHAAAARLRTLAENKLDTIGTPQIVRIHAITRRQHLIDKGFGGFALLGCHATVAGSRAGTY